MISPSSRRRWVIALRGYAVVAVFGVTLLALRLLATGLSPSEALVLSAALAVPLALALFWENIKGFRVGQLEITLAEVSLPVDIELSAAVQGLRGSETPELVEAIVAVSERPDCRLVEVNLRSTPYWWSTRLFLLAALAEEYTQIERLVFVEQDAARIYIGTASPRDVREALEDRFPDYGLKYRGVRDGARAGDGSARHQVEAIGYQWPHLFLPPESEKEVRELVTPVELREWLGRVLAADAREWDGSPAGPALYARILTCRMDYVPLLRGQRLEEVVSSAVLIRRLAESAVAQAPT